MAIRKLWPAQAKQDEGLFTLVIDGQTDWKSFLNEKIKLKGDFWISRCGGSEVPLVDYLLIEAEANDVSFERCVLNTLLDKGFTLDELEVEFWSEERAKWGLCSWCKEHPNYADPVQGFEKAHPRWTPFVRSFFKTEKAGEQEFCLFSMQMVSASLIGQPSGILLHKTLLFRKAVMSSPQKEAQAA